MESQMNHDFRHGSLRVGILRARFKPKFPIILLTGSSVPRSCGSVCAAAACSQASAPPRFRQCRIWTIHDGSPLSLSLYVELEIGIRRRRRIVSEPETGGEVVGGDVAAAEGAGGVLLEPLVDTADVEGVVAFGEEAKDVGSSNLARQTAHSRPRREEKWKKGRASMWDLSMPEADRERGWWWRRWQNLA